MLKNIAQEHNIEAIIWELRGFQHAEMNSVSLPAGELDHLGVNLDPPCLKPLFSRCCKKVSSSTPDIEEAPPCGGVSRNQFKYPTGFLKELFFIRDIIPLPEPAHVVFIEILFGVKGEQRGFGRSGLEESQTAATTLNEKEVFTFEVVGIWKGLVITQATQVTGADMTLIGQCSFEDTYQIDLPKANLARTNARPASRWSGASEAANPSCTPIR